MRLYRKVNPLASGVAAKKRNKAVLFINSGAIVATINVSIKNSDGSTTTTEMFINGTGAVTSFVGPVNYFIYPFSIQSWSLVFGTVNAYELY